MRAKECQGQNGRLPLFVSFNNLEQNWSNEHQPDDGWKNKKRDKKYRPREGTFQLLPVILQTSKSRESNFYNHIHKELQRSLTPLFRPKEKANARRSQ